MQKRIVFVEKHEFVKFPYCFTQGWASIMTTSCLPGMARLVSRHLIVVLVSIFCEMSAWMCFLCAFVRLLVHVTMCDMTLWATRTCLHDVDNLQHAGYQDGPLLYEYHSRGLLSVNDSWTAYSGIQRMSTSPHKDQCIQLRLNRTSKPQPYFMLSSLATVWAFENHVSSWVIFAI